MMQVLIVTKKLNKRRVIPSALPDSNNIVGTVNENFIFYAEEVKNVPNPTLGKWFRDADGYFYWGGAVKPYVFPDKDLTIQQIKAATGASNANAAKFQLYIEETCDRWKINTPIRKLCFLAQVGHESGGLFYTEELASGKAYEGRTDLGNTETGDGMKFKGRGLIQITGRFNYQSLSDSLKETFITNPEFLGGRNVNHCNPKQLKHAAQSAGWFWDREQLNLIADNINIHANIDEGDNLIHFKKITKKINGGYNGLQDRVNKYMAGVAWFRS